MNAKLEIITKDDCSMIILISVLKLYYPPSEYTYVNKKSDPTYTIGWLEDNTNLQLTFYLTFWFVIWLFIPFWSRDSDWENRYEIK